MRRLISLILCIAMLISSSTVVLADESTEEVYNTVSVEFSDSIGNIETLQIMVKNDNVYANAKELGERLGYDVAISEEYVSIYNQDADETVPYGLTVFYYDSTKVGHMLFTQMVDSYEAPFETIKHIYYMTCTSNYFPINICISKVFIPIKRISIEIF